jgi:hypothetical protein
VIEPREVVSTLTARAEFGRGAHDVLLRVPPVRQALPALPDLNDVGTRDQFRRIIRLELLAIVESVDGREATFADVDQIMGTPEALRVVLETRNQVYASLRQSGHFYFACPQCGTEAGFDLGTYAVLGLRLSELPPIVTPTLLSMPRLSAQPPSARRPDGVPRSKPIRFELPTVRAGLDTPYTGGILGDLDANRIEEAWQSAAPPHVDRPTGRNHWQRENPGFTAILHLSLALDRLDGATKASPEIIEKMLVPDFYYLDAVYYLTHAVDIGDGTLLVAPCPSCGQVYLRAR